MCFLHKILVFSNDKKTVHQKKSKVHAQQVRDSDLSVNSLDNRKLKAIISQTQVNARMTSVKPNPSVYCNKIEIFMALQKINDP